MRYVVVGAGAIGGTIGGRLYESGRDVVLIARGAHYEAIKERGLTLATPEGVLTLPIPVENGSLRTREDDVVILAVKSQDTLAALDQWPRPVPIVCAQNGVANERMALRRFANVYGVRVLLPALHLDPGVVVAPCAPKSGVLHLGRYPRGVDGLAERVAADLSASRFVAMADDDVMRWKYAKLVQNLANAVEALCGRVPGIDDLTARARAEGRTVLTSAGIDWASDEEVRNVWKDQMEVRPVEGASHGGSSSWQSLARGTGSVESDYLNGEIVLLGRLHGVATPVNEVLQRESRKFAVEVRPPGSMPVQELIEKIAPAGGERATGIEPA